MLEKAGDFARFARRLNLDKIKYYSRSNPSKVHCATAVARQFAAYWNVTRQEDHLSLRSSTPLANVSIS